MLPLAGENFPKTTDELTAALRKGFEARGVTPKEIVAEGAEFPKLSALTVDLTGGQATRESRANASTAGNAGMLEVARLALFGEPVYFEKTPLEARIEASDVKLRFAGDAANGTLVPESAAAGTVSVRITVEALEALLLSVASQAASKQGVDVKQTKLTLTQDGPRAVSFRAEVTAKVFIMSAALALTGKLEIDDEFNARVSGLELGGDPMVTNLAGSFLRPRLQQLEGRSFPLLAFSPGGLKLRDIELSVTPALSVKALFGTEA